MTITLFKEIKPQPYKHFLFFIQIYSHNYILTIADNLEAVVYNVKSETALCEFFSRYVYPGEWFEQRQTVNQS